MDSYHGTTIVSIRRKTPTGWQVAMGGDGQVTLGHIVVKATARKVRRLYHKQVLAGFAGATADAFFVGTAAFAFWWAIAFSPILARANSRSAPPQQRCRRCAPS